MTQNWDDTESNFSEMHRFFHQKSKFLINFCQILLEYHIMFTMSTGRPKAKYGQHLNDTVALLNFFMNGSRAAAPKGMKSC